VPTVEELETRYVQTRELGLFLKEQGMKRRQFASELSDGTLRTISIFLPLVDRRYSLVAIEEPENSIHPWVTRQFVTACRERSSEKQIILTTHSPVLVSSLRPAELFIAERKDGQSVITPATAVGKEVEEVIRKGIMDLGSYWDSGAMRAVPVRQSDFLDTLKHAE
jgi:predicted ATPase